MKNLARMLCIAMTLLSAIACSDKKKTPEPVAQQNQGVIPQAQVDALNKAKNVENVIMQDADRQREQAEKESQ